MRISIRTLRYIYFLRTTNPPADLHNYGSFALQSEIKVTNIYLYAFGARKAPPTDICQPGDHASKPHTFTSRKTMRISTRTLGYIYFLRTTNPPTDLRNFGSFALRRNQSQKHLSVPFRCPQRQYRRISANLAITQVNLTPSRQARR